MHSFAKNQKHVVTCSGVVVLSPYMEITLPKIPTWTKSSAYVNTHDDFSTILMYHVHCHINEVLQKEEILRPQSLI